MKKQKPPKRRFLESSLTMIIVGIEKRKNYGDIVTLKCGRRLLTQKLFL